MALFANRIGVTVAGATTQPARTVRGSAAAAAPTENATRAAVNIASARPDRRMRFLLCNRSRAIVERMKLVRPLIPSAVEGRRASLAVPRLPRHAFPMSDPVSSGRGPSVRTVPDGDTRERMVCPDCGFVAYENPKIVVGSVVVSGDRFLLCRRAIEPRRGYWTLPAGYLEVNESTMAGAAREAFEEAHARISIDGLLAVYDIPRISQVQVIYRARLAEPA